jgi:hypothetical protein
LGMRKWGGGAISATVWSVPDQGLRSDSPASTSRSSTAVLIALGQTRLCETLDPSRKRAVFLVLGHGDAPSCSDRAA